MPHVMERPVAAGPWPVVAALGFIAIVAASLWWQTREQPAPLPMAAASAPPAAPATPATREPPAATRDFLAFAAQPAPAELPLDHGYTADGLRRIARAVAASGGNALWRDRAKRIEEQAAALEQDPASLQHADIARETFLDVADWLGYAPARAAAEAIRPEEPLRAQGEQVRRFFQAVGARLQQGEA